MQLRLSVRSLLAFLVLVLLIQELHELAHHIIGYICCGCFGKRDLLYWKLCTGCSTNTAFVITAIAGPVVNYMLMWTGVFLLNNDQTNSKKSLGFALIFAALPLPRLMAVANRGGDETAALRYIFNNGFHGSAVIISALLIILLTLPVLWKVFKLMARKNRLLIFTGLLVIPWLLDYVLIALGLNNLFNWNDQAYYFGLPIPVIAWQVILAGSALSLRKDLLQLAFQPLNKTH